MLIENQLIQVSWNRKNRDYYKNIGYHYTKLDDKFYVKAEDLPDNSDKIVKVKCDCCGNIFETTYKHYKKIICNNKSFCNVCDKENKKNERLIKHQNELYDKLLIACDEFQYTLLTKKEELKNYNTQVTYICPKHGVQKSTVGSLLEHKSCRLCANEIRGQKTQERWNKTLAVRQDKIFNQCLEICEDEGYTMLTEKSQIKNINTYIEYECRKHGIKKIKISNFLIGKRCADCAHEKARIKFAFTPDEVYEKVKALGGELLNKEDYINQDVKNLKIICPRCHKNIFTTSLKHFVQHGGQSCSDCYLKESVGERKIREWLENNNFEFIQEKWFDDCRDIKPLPFDFYLPDNNTIIEFDGKQHFEDTHFFTRINEGRRFDSVTSYTQYHDFIKTNYCKSNNISLIRIPYTEINNIENILKEKLIA